MLRPTTQGETTIATLRKLAPATVGALAAFALVVALLPAGMPVYAAVEKPIRNVVPRIDPPAVVAPMPTPTPAPQAVTVTPSPTPRPTLSGTMPPATIPPTPVPPPPVVPTPVPATQFARVIGTHKYNNLYSSTSTLSTILVKVPHGQIAGLFSITTSGTWYKATYRGKTGYLLTSRMQRISLIGQTIATQYSRVIVLGVASQQVEVWDHQRLMVISAVTTGRPELPTPLGTTKVILKQSPHLFQSPWAWPSIYWYPPGWADYAVEFRSGGYYFHDTHARPEYGYGIGTNVLHYDLDGVQRTGSRGCANTPFWAEQEIYGWSILGDPVVTINK
jgi:hypothetical protein